MRKLIAATAVALMVAAPVAANPGEDRGQGQGQGQSQGTGQGQGHGSPLGGDIGSHPALYGLCKAYFSGQGGQNGNKNSAPPFAALEKAASDNDQTVAEFCDGVRPSNGQGRGNQDNSSAPNPAP